MQGQRRPLTSSLLKAFRRCARLYFLRYVLGYRAAREDDALRFGTLIHLALEAWWLSIPQGADVAIDAALSALQVEGAYPFDQVRAEELIIGYHLRWKDEPLEPLSVEAEFACDLVNPVTGAPSKTWRLAGKEDAIVRDRATGRILIVEHKTTGEDIGVGSTYWQRLQMDGQISQYFAGAKALGFDASACIYDVIKKPTIRPYKATPTESRKYTKDGRLYANQRDIDETPDEFRARLRADIVSDFDRYYQRGEVVRLEADVAAYAFDTWQQAQIIRASEIARRPPGTMPPRNTDACFLYGRSPCSYWAACSGSASLDDPLYYVQSEDVHPELSQEAA